MRAAPGTDFALLIARDPRSLLATWQVTPATRLRALRALGRRAVGAVPACRLRRGDGRVCEAELPPDAAEWVARAEPAQGYVLEVGIRTADGGFTTLARSAPTTTPAAEPSPDHTVRWVSAAAPTLPRTWAWSGRRVDVPATPRPQRGSSDVHGS